jgi:polysaccharide deacetylase family protein (PEP-CTERM system associated)
VENCDRAIEMTMATPHILLNSFTVDVEEWYHANYAGSPVAPSEPDHFVIGESQRLLELLATASVRATFFVLGETGAKYPALIRQIALAGHEIASHGLTHDLVYEMDREAFRHQARQSKVLLEGIVDTSVVGFRAPSWSVGPMTPWFWEELRDAGYLYSSSLFPFATPLYGDAQAPWFPHFRDGVLELPPTTARLFGRRLPFSGGFYLRALPALAISRFSRTVNGENEAVIYYIHPREIDPNQPRLHLSYLNRMIHYWGIRGTPRKLRLILSNSAFQTMFELYESIA